jgi:hypothetical protein
MLSFSLFPLSEASNEKGHSTGSNGESTGRSHCFYLPPLDDESPDVRKKNPMPQERERVEPDTGF